MPSKCQCKIKSIKLCLPDKRFLKKRQGHTQLIEKNHWFLYFRLVCVWKQVWTIYITLWRVRVLSNGRSLTAITMLFKGAFLIKSCTFKQITWRVPRNRASESPRRGTQSQIVWIVLTFLRVNVNPSSNLISLEIGNIHPNVKSSSIVRTAFMIRMQYEFWSSKKPFQKKTQQGWLRPSEGFDRQTWVWDHITKLRWDQTKHMWDHITKSNLGRTAAIVCRQ